MVSPKTIASNTAWYIIALTSQKVVSFVYFTFLARYLGPENTGKYFFAVSFTFIFAVLTDLGMSALLTREVAKFKEQGDRLLSQIISLKIVTSLIVVGLLILATPLITQDALTVKLIIIASAAMLLDGFSLISYAAIRGRQNLKYESQATILHQLIVLGLGLWFIKMNKPVDWLIIALLAASVFQFLWSLSAAIFRIKFRLRLLWDNKLLKSLYLALIPFSLAAIFTRVYAYIDTVLLQIIKGDEAVGIYAIAYKITFAFQFLPLAFIAALYPAFSYYWQHDREMLYISFSKSLQYLLIAALPITIGLWILAPALIPTVYSDSFEASIIPFQILIATLPFLFLNFTFGSLLNATGKQKWQTIILAVGMSLNIIFNLILIPLLGPIGAAVSSTSGTLIVFIISLILAARVCAYDKKLLIQTAYKTLIIGAAMALLISILSHYISWYWTVLPGAVVYIAGIWFWKLLTIQDLNSFRSSVIKR